MNESQLTKMVTEAVKKVLNEGLQNWFEKPADSVPSNYNIPEYENASEYSDLIEWIRKNVEDYVYFDDRYTMPSDRARFDTNGFIESLIKFLDTLN